MPHLPNRRLGQADRAGMLTASGLGCFMCIEKHRDSSDGQERPGFGDRTLWPLRLGLCSGGAHDTLLSMM
ncbi:hypothetical protein BJX70DRAFT_129734 [Aspergillus crustosus]